MQSILRTAFLSRSSFISGAPICPVVRPDSCDPEGGREERPFSDILQRDWIRNQILSVEELDSGGRAEVRGLKDIMIICEMLWG